MELYHPSKTFDRTLYLAGKAFIYFPHDMKFFVLRQRQVNADRILAGEYAVAVQNLSDVNSEFHVVGIEEVEVYNVGYYLRDSISVRWNLIKFLIDGVPMEEAVPMALL